MNCEEKFTSERHDLTALSFITDACVGSTVMHFEKNAKKNFLPCTFWGEEGGLKKDAVSKTLIILNLPKCWEYG